MNELKMYVIQNFDYETKDDYEMVTYKYFLSFIDNLKVTRNKEKFDLLMREFTDPEEGYYMYVIILSILVMKNENILTLNIEFIKDIISSFNDIELSYPRYEQYLRIVMNPNILYWLEKFHGLTEEKNFVPYHILVSMLDDVNFFNNDANIIKNATDYLNKAYVNHFQKVEIKPWFDESFDLIKIYNKLYEEMVNMNKFSVDYGSVEVFDDRDFENLKCVKELTKLPTEEQEKFLSYVLEHDKEESAIVGKCKGILNAAKICYNVYGNKLNNVFYPNFGK